MALIKKRWFKYANEKREEIQKKFFSENGREMSAEEAKDIPPAHPFFVMRKLELSLLSRKNNSLKCVYYNASEENTLCLYIGVPFLFSVGIEVELNHDYYVSKFGELKKEEYETKTGFKFGRHFVDLAFRYFIHPYEPDKNKGFHIYECWETIFKGEKEVFDVKSKRDDFTFNETITVPYHPHYHSEGIKPDEFGNVTFPITFTVKERIFLTRYTRFIPSVYNTYQVISSGPTIKDNRHLDVILNNDYIYRKGEVLSVHLAYEDYSKDLREKLVSFARQNKL